MARPRIEVSKSVAKSIASQYTKGSGLTALAQEFTLSIPVIRRTLVERGVTLRGRGRPKVA